MREPFHVLIIGGGIGGLTLAQGLERAGVSAAVYERDRTLTDRLQRLPGAHQSDRRPRLA